MLEKGQVMQDGPAPKRKTHVLQKMSLSGSNKVLALVCGAAIALLDAETQREILDIILRKSKRQHRTEVLDAAEAAEVPVDAELTSKVRLGQSLVAATTSVL